jgi:hypothetical protein
MQEYRILREIQEISTEWRHIEGELNRKGWEGPGFKYWHMYAAR